MPKLMLLPLTGSLLLALLAAPVAAETLYRWTAADGSVSFSDDVKRIPSQYRASATRMRTGDLAGYARYTPAETRAARTDRSEALAARIDRLRAFNEEAAAPAYGKRGAQSDVILRLDNRASVTIPNDGSASDEPVVVEERRVRDRNNISTTHVTVVRRGDEILSVVRPESAHDRADWADERELLGEE